MGYWQALTLGLVRADSWSVRLELQVATRVQMLLAAVLLWLTKARAMLVAVAVVLALSLL